LASAGVTVLVLPIGVSLATAERFLQGPPTFAFPGETGQPSARCQHTGLFGLLGSVDTCTLTFPSGDYYRCSVDPPGFAGPSSAGISASCDRKRFRPRAAVLRSKDASTRT
jgi:hypothetical protein